MKAYKEAAKNLKPGMKFRYGDRTLEVVDFLGEEHGGKLVRFWVRHEGGALSTCGLFPNKAVWVVS